MDGRMDTYGGGGGRDKMGEKGGASLFLFLTEFGL